MHFKVGAVFCRIHPLLPILCAGSILCGTGDMLLASILALCWHELGHFTAARCCKIPVLSIELTPFGGVMQCSTARATILRQCLLSLSGPFSSFLGYLLCYYSLLQPNAHVPFLLNSLRMHLLLFLINLLPVLPLDGGQILMACFRAYPGIKKWLCMSGAIIGLTLIALSIIYALHNQLLLGPAFAGCCLIYAAAIQHRDAAAQCIHQIILEKIRLKKGKLLPIAYWAADSDLTVLTLSRMLPSNRLSRIQVYDAQADRMIGEISQHQLVEMLLTDPSLPLKKACQDPRGASIAKSDAL